IRVGDYYSAVSIGAPVKNAPFSADAVTETTQVLTDGNHILQRTTQKLYRDTDGRERREESVLAVGTLTQQDTPRLVTISDPVQNVSYTLDPTNRTARRSVGAAVPIVHTINAGGLGANTEGQPGVRWYSATAESTLYAIRTPKSPDTSGE